MCRIEEITNQCKLLLEIPLYEKDFKEFLKNNINGIEEKTLSLVKDYLLPIIFFNLPILDDIESFNISWIDGFDWSKISKSSVSAEFLKRFDTLELGE